MIKTVVRRGAIAIVAIALLLTPTMCIDYFGDGCMVSHYGWKAREVSPGVTISERVAIVECEQLIIHTEAGRKAKTR